MKLGECCMKNLRELHRPFCNLLVRLLEDIKQHFYRHFINLNTNLTRTGPSGTNPLRLSLAQGLVEGVPSQQLLLVLRNHGDSGQKVESGNIETSFSCELLTSAMGTIP